MDAQPERFAALRPAEAVAAWIAWALGPGLFVLSTRMADQMPAWLGPTSPLKWVSLLVTLAMVFIRGEHRRTPEFWLLVVCWAGFGMTFLWLNILSAIPLVAAAVAAVALPIVGGARLAMYLWRYCRVRPPAV